MEFSVNSTLERFLKKHQIAVMIDGTYLGLDEADEYVQEKLKECLKDKSINL